MVDIVANNVMATSTTPDYSKYMFKDKVRNKCPFFLSLVNVCLIVSVSHLLSCCLGRSAE